MIGNAREFPGYAQRGGDRDSDDAVSIIGNNLMNV